MASFGELLCGEADLRPRVAGNHQAYRLCNAKRLSPPGTDFATALSILLRYRLSQARGTANERRSLRFRG